jgi:ubiquinone/menaquinone biosynthesis C-methylase UbiE
MKDNYSHSASNYDTVITTFDKFWSLFGFRYSKYRKHAIEFLQLHPGQSVLDLGCGTGINFSDLQKKLKGTGHITGIDISGSMIKEAQQKIFKNNWQNISLTIDDYTKCELPKVDKIISTYSLGLFPYYDRVIFKAKLALKKDGIFVILHFNAKDLSKSAKAFLPFWTSCIKDFDYKTFKNETKNPWDAIQKYFDEYHCIDYYGGLVQISIGVKR